MYIQDSIVDLILDTCKFEYNGCHAPHPKTPLYGRAAYWRAYLPDGTYVCKITTPVKVMEPKPETLRKLLKLELKKRIGEITEVCTMYYCTNILIEYRDPYRVKPLVESVCGKYIDLETRY